jgi:hypothetical protein
VTYVEVTGWNIEGESVEDSGSTRPGEDVDSLIARMRERSLIVEVGDVRVYGENGGTA